MLLLLIRTVWTKRFSWWVTKYVLVEKYGKLSLNYPSYPFLSGAVRCHFARFDRFRKIKSILKYSMEKVKFVDRIVIVNQGGDNL